MYLVCSLLSVKLFSPHLVKAEDLFIFLDWIAVNTYICCKLISSSDLMRMGLGLVNEFIKENCETLLCVDACWA